MSASPSGAESDRIGADLQTLSEFTDGGPGCSRTLTGAAYRDSREWVANLMRSTGLEVVRDPSGSIVGTLEGEDPTAPAILVGSHTDTVTSGGNFDGTVGVLGAIEMVRLLREGGVRPRRPIRVIDFLGEESNEHGLTCLGSRSMVGELTRADLNRLNAGGLSLGDQCARIGLDPAEMIGGRSEILDNALAFIELHIEQGPVLEQRDVPIGVVTAIAGIERLLARFVGQADHAGTRPMSDRRDALAAAAHAVLAVRQLGCDSDNVGVATTSQVTTYPGSPNVVPGSARMEAEVRSTDHVWLDTARSRLVHEVFEQAAELGVEAEFEWVQDNQPLHLDESLQSMIGTAAESLGHSWIPIPSGATHDAAHLAHVVPTAMIFIPCADGRSHCPEEWAALPDIVRGVEVLTQTVLAVDRR